MSEPEPVPDPVLAQLERLGVAFEIVACDPDLADTAQFCDAYGYSPEDSANSIVVVGKADPRVFALCLVLATDRLDVNGVVRKRLGTRKASFASAEDTVELTGMMIGGVTPFGVPGDLPVWIDARVMQRDRVIVGGGSRARKILLPPTALSSLDAAEVVTDLARPAL